MTPQIDKGSVGKGVGLGLLLHLLQFLIIPVVKLLGTSEAAMAGLMIGLGAWGLTQFLYLGPAALIFRKKGETETAKGILILAGIGVLLNGACDASLMIR